VNVGSFGGRDEKFKIHACGVKAYAAVVYAQTAIVAGLDLAKAIGGNVDRIVSIEIGTTLRGYEQAGRDREKWTPQTRDTADHSLPYLTARALVDGDITNATYAPEKLREPKILALMQKITVKEDPAFAKPRGNAPPTRLTATLTDGSIVVRQVDDMPGFPGKPMDRAGMERKFRSNVGTRWPAATVDAQLKALWDFDRAPDVRAFLGRFAL
jgi:2-methylcitrate dehydratase